MIKKALILSFMLVTSFCYADNPEIICSPTECYHIEKELGYGAFGKVYAVRDSNGQLFALKNYFNNEHPDQIFNILSDAKREFDIGQALNHPNIIKSVDYFSDDKNSRYVLLEYVEGKRVSSTTRKSLSGDQAILLSNQLLSALKYGIEMKYFHVDLHASNVMIDDSMNLKVIDVSSFFSFEEIELLFSWQNPKALHDNPIREEKLRRFVARHQTQFNLIKKSKGVVTSAQVINYFSAMNFKDIVDMMIDIISKSDMEREKKIELFANIKKVSWNYLEDLQDGLNLPINTYFDQLEEIIK